MYSTLQCRLLEPDVEGLHLYAVEEISVKYMALINTGPKGRFFLFFLYILTAHAAG